MALLGLIVIGLLAFGFWCWIRDEFPDQSSSGLPDFPTHVYGRTLTRVHLSERQPNGYERSISLDYASPDRLTPQQIQAYEALGGDHQRPALGSVSRDALPGLSGASSRPAALPAAGHQPMRDSGYVDVGEYLGDAEVQYLREQWRVSGGDNY